MNRILCLLIFLLISGFTARSNAQEIGTATEIVYLSGKGNSDAVLWDFYCTGGRNSGKWTKIAVPSCWEQQGFGAYTYGVNFYGKETHPGISNEQGLYKHTFKVPAEWQGKTIRLVFEGAMTDTRVTINGTKAGDVHQGGFYRFRYDVSNYLKYGADNFLEVEVKKESDDPSVNLAERRADYWNFGGIFRPVFLEVLPTVCIDRVAVDAGADGHFSAEVFLAQAAQFPLEVSAQLFGADGKPVGKSISSAVVPAGDKAVVRSYFENIKTWTAETPNLYSVRFTLSREGKTLHQVNERIGFRTIVILEGDGIYVNGTKVNLRGVNRHSFRPETGRTLNREQNYEDVRLIKAMNNNTVRLSHYPADPEFLEACDELGLYVLNELGGWHGRYNTGVGRKLVYGLVQRDVNHPSVIIWDNGNEGGWNVELDKEFAVYDPQNRPVIHPQQDLSGLETMHYRSYGETQEYLRGPLIFFPTEFLHGLYDGGHGAGLYDYWQMMYPHPRCAGGLLWVLADEGVVRTDLGGKIDNDGNHGADGIVGPHHEKEGSYETIREIWSPVYIDMKKLPEDFNGKIPVENRYDFTNLNQCTLTWKLVLLPGYGQVSGPVKSLSEGTLKGPDLAPRSKGEIDLKLPADWKKAHVLYLTATDSFGQEVYTWSWNLMQQGPIWSSGIDAAKAEVEFAGYYLLARAGDLELQFDRDSGMLLKVLRKGKTISFANGPRFVAFRRGDRSPDGWMAESVTKGIDRVYNEVSSGSKLTDIQYFNEGENAVIETRFSGDLESARWTISPKGEVRLDYAYRYDGVVELMGIRFDYPEEKVQTKTWLGEGPYRVWQNRLHGTTLNVWSCDYNDPIPGETFTYPEFKGYFGNWHWTRFKTSEGTIGLATANYNQYLGVYSPRDGRDKLLYTFPESGLAILDVIPAVRNKVNTTDLNGPSAQAQHVSGTRKGTIWLAFD